MRVKLGCDPEAFLHNGFEFVSAFGLLPGTKDYPHEVEKGMFQVDGLAVEFGIDPADSEDEFNRNIEVVLAQVNEYIKKIDSSFTLKFVPMATFTVDYFNDLPDDCKLLGCEPDYDFKGQMKVPDSELINRPFRSAGGHVHIGWSQHLNPFDPKHFEDCRFIADRFKNRQFFFPVSVDERKRVQYYGSLGSFRPKTYGVELRSPSNIWVAQERTRRQMYQTVVSTMQDISR